MFPNKDVDQFVGRADPSVNGKDEGTVAGLVARLLVRSDVSTTAASEALRAAALARMLDAARFFARRTSRGTGHSLHAPHPAPERGRHCPRGVAFGKVRIEQACWRTFSL
jgi:hypothetical protein